MYISIFYEYLFIIAAHMIETVVFPEKESTLEVYQIEKTDKILTKSIAVIIQLVNIKFMTRSVTARSRMNSGHHGEGGWRGGGS